MSKPTRWLHAEIEQWIAAGIISPGQAEQLRARYPEGRDSPVPWGLLVFATTGAIVLGLGVILLFAYNWDGIPKFGKLALIFSAVIAAHATGIALARKGRWQARLGEALTALGTMFYGAGIWLIAQVYNIDEHYPNGFLWWGLGALAVSWALRSTANGLIATVLFAIWGLTDSLDFHRGHYGAVALIAAGLMPLAWKNRSALLLAFSLIGVQLLAAVNFGVVGTTAHSLSGSLALAVLAVAAGRLVAAREPSFQSGARVLTACGFAAFILCAYILSYSRTGGDLLDWERQIGAAKALTGIVGWGIFAAALTGWAALLRRALQRRTAVAREDWLLPIAAIYAFGLAALHLSQFGEFIAWSFSLILLGLAIMWMWRGCQQSALGLTLIGSLLLAAVMLGRYFDLFDDLASRGIAFIILGGIFLAEAMYYRKVRRSSEDAP